MKRKAAQIFHKACLTRREFLGALGGAAVACGMGSAVWAAQPAVNERLYELTGLRRSAGVVPVPANDAVAPQLAERNEQHLLAEPAEAFMAMRDAARRDGIELVLDWAYRDFEQQREMWNSRVRRWKRLKTVFRYISVPGTSFHHFGTEIDIRGPLPRPQNVRPRDFTGKGRFARYFRWMERKADDFGFHLTYPPRRSGGIGFEPWHYSYTAIQQRMVKEYLDAAGEIIPLILGNRGILKIDSLDEAFMRRYLHAYVAPALRRG